MNPLEALKQKLKVKPTVEQRKPVEVVLQIPVPEKKVQFKIEEEEKNVLPQKEISQKLTIVDKRSEGFDRETLMKKMAESKKLKVTVKPVLKASEEHVTKAPIVAPVKRAKKVTQKPKLIIEEEEEEEPKKEEEPVELKEEEEIMIIAPKKRERKTKKVEKGVAVLGPESVVIIDDKPISDRLPKKQPNVIVRVPNYYMNNREIFVNFINSLFEPYRKELEENKENISCDTIGQGGSDFSLLTHQKIVRDYMNLYTPYRGLLLYHGLGSGKCHKKDTPIIMFDGTIKMVQDIQVGDLLMGDDSTQRTVTSLAKGRDKMYDIIPIKGEKYTVNEEHILCLKNQKHNIIEISVKNYIELTEKEKSLLKGYKVPIEFPDKEVSIDPYQFGFNLNEKTTTHLPHDYKCNSREKRLKLLAGLLDRKGKGINQNDTLTKDIFYLVRSLGFDCEFDLNHSKIMIYGEGIEKIPFKIYSVSKEQQIKDVLVTGITVKYVNEDDYYGFTLDGNCRYVMGDFTVTHNTCTSIAIAEGMKEAKRVIIMTPASLRTNYMEELKKCGDLLYKKNQYWEWISDPEALPAISASLNLPLEYIRKKKGAWFINIKKRANYSELSSDDKKSVDEQLDEMIRNKYIFINYNGLRNERLRELTSGFTRNLFDHSIVIIDEAHNLVSRIVNKIKKEKPIPESERGEKEHAPKFLSSKLYEYLLSAQDARVVLLTGTPVINYPNEFGILFNIMRGYIKTWEFALDIKTSKKIDRVSLQEILMGEKTLDYLDYSPSSKILTITRNPFGFKNKIQRGVGYQGVSADSNFYSDDDFERGIIGLLKKNDIDVLPRGIKIRNKKALPDTMELFEGNYIDSGTNELKNVDALKRRVLGLSSYFRSAQESLLPKYNKTLGVDYHIVRVPMSNFQFNIYEGARIEERELESKSKKNKKPSNSDDLYKESSSTYRIFSRLFCNFVMPNRPTPKQIKIEHAFKALDKSLETMQIESMFQKLKQQMKPGLDSILNQIPDQEERNEWEKKIDIELHSYILDVIEAQKKDKTASDKKLLNLLKEVQKAEEIIAKTKESKKAKVEEIENIGKRLEAFDLERALEESGSKPEEKELTQEEKNTMVALLKEARNMENTQDVIDDQEGEIEGDQILDKIGGDEYKKRLEEAIQHIEEHSNDFLTPEALQTYSPKFLHVLENIQDPDHVGLHLVYSQFRTLEGVGIFSLVLKKNGFAQFKIKRSNSGQWAIDISEFDVGKPMFALYSGTETAEEKEIIRNIYNGDWNYIPTDIANDLKKIANNNNMGEIIKVLMITSSGSEGINLRNTRYVHIMEPYWHPVRMEQVIGRARRICSHKSLPQNLQTVEVFVYLMEFTAEQLKSDLSKELKRKDLSKSVPHVPITSDQYLYEISEIKLKLTNQLTDIIKQSAFDCSIYANGKCVNFAEPTNSQFSYVPDYAEQASDVTIRSNIQKIEWVGKSITINGVEYVYRRISPTVLNIYDKNSYLRAMENSQLNPLLIGTYEINERGERVFRQLVT